MQAYTLASTQKSIYLYQEIKGTSCLFNIGGYAILNKELDLPVFLKAFECIVKRHSALRLRLITIEGAVSQYIETNSNSDIEYIDFSKEENPEKRCLERITEDFQKPLILHDGPLYYSSLIKQSDNKFYWYLKLHHIIGDGFSMAVIFNEINAIYYKLLQTNTIEQAQSPGFIDYILFEQEYKNSLKYIQDKQFWLEKLKNPPNHLTLKKQASNDLRSDRAELLLERADINKISNYCHEHGVSLFHYFIAITYIFCLNIFTSDDFVIGIPVLNRSGKNTKKEVGPYFSVLPFRMHYNNQLTVLELLKKIKTEVLSAVKHMHFPILDTIQALNHTGNLYNTTFSYQKFLYESQIDDKGSEIVYLKNKEQMDDLDIHVLDFNDDWNVKIIFDYKTSYMDPEVAADLVARFKRLILTLYRDDSQKIFEISVLENNKKKSLNQLGNFQF